MCVVLPIEEQVPTSNNQEDDDLAVDNPIDKDDNLEVIKATDEINENQVNVQQKNVNVSDEEDFIGFTDEEVTDALNIRDRLNKLKNSD